MAGEVVELSPIPARKRGPGRPKLTGAQKRAAEAERQRRSRDGKAGETTVPLAKLPAPPGPPEPPPPASRDATVGHVWSERVINALFVIGAIIGGFALWALVATPMMQTFGAAYVGQGFGTWRVGQLLAAVVVLFEALLGIDVMMSARRRQWGRFAASLLLLIGLAAVEVGVAYERETLRVARDISSCMMKLPEDATAGDKTDCHVTYAGDAIGLWLQMGLAGMMPFALMFAAEKWHALWGARRRKVT